MKLIAIDPGITKTGIIVAESKFPSSLTIEKIYWVDKEVDWNTTLLKVYDTLTGLGNEQTMFAIEEPVVFHRGGNRIVKQAMFVGAIIGFLQIYNKIPVDYDVVYNDKIYLVKPTTAKLALTGKGNAKKDMMVKVATINYPDIRWNDFSKSTKETIADAIGIGLAVTKKLNGVTRLE